MTPVRITRDVGLCGNYTGLMSVTADLDWWRRVLVHLPNDFPGAGEIALHRLALLESESGERVTATSAHEAHNAPPHPQSAQITRAYRKWLGISDESGKAK